MADYFDSTACSKGIAIKNNEIIKNDDWSGSTVFLSNVVKTGVHRWRFLLKKSDDYTVHIGIWKTKHQLVTDDYLTDDKACYSYSVFHAGLLGAGNDSYGRRCTQGDKVDMLLDLNKLELSYFVNDKDYGVAFRVDETEYRAAVSLFNQGDIVELVSYEQESAVVNVPDDDEVKCDRCNHFKKEIVSLKQTHLFAISENESIISAMQQRIDTLEAEKKELQGKYDDSSAECKELQMELKTVSAKYNALYRKTNINTENYLTWDSDTITDWIISLNEEYEAYEHQLRVKMEEEEVEGSLLSELDRNDLHRFGVILLKHKVQILKHIKALVKQNNLQSAMIASAEGDDGTPYI
eukprot:630144_1